MSREQTVRDVAYAIWEAEGKPKGRDTAHWQEAEARVAATLEGKSADAKAKPPAKGKLPSEPKAPAALKPPAKAAATKAAPTKTGSAKPASSKKS